MKIAISSSGKTLESPVDPRFGRASSFIVFETEDRSFEVVDNEQSYNLPQGAGIQAAGTVSRTGVKAVLTGHCGPKAYKALNAAGIEVFVGVQGSVSESIQSYESGKLQRAGGPDVQGHW